MYCRSNKLRLLEQKRGKTFFISCFVMNFIFNKSNETCVRCLHERRTCWMRTKAAIRSHWFAAFAHTHTQLLRSYFITEACNAWTSSLRLVAHKSIRTKWNPQWRWMGRLNRNENSVKRFFFCAFKQDFRAFIVECLRTVWRRFRNIDKNYFPCERFVIPFFASFFRFFRS